MPFDSLGGPDRDPDDADLLIAARNLIDFPGAWIKHAYYRQEHGQKRFCAMGALAVACDSGFAFPSRKAHRLARYLVNEMPRRGGYLLRYISAPMRVRAYNDSSNTTQNEVIALFDKAIQRLAPYRSSWPVKAHAILDGGGNRV